MSVNYLIKSMGTKNGSVPVATLLLGKFLVGPWIQLFAFGILKLSGVITLWAIKPPLVKLWEMISLG